MKFSLKLLLAITLLTVLIVNGVNNRHQASLIVAECESIEEAIGVQLRATKYYEEKKLVYERAATAFQRRKERLADADDSFSRVAKFHGELTIQDPDKIHVWTLPGDVVANSVNKRFRIWIPESTSLELCLGYQGVWERDKNLPLNDSFYFSPKERFIRKLEPGECFVELTLDESNLDSSSVVQVIVDGVIEHSAKKKPVGSRGVFFPFKRIATLVDSGEEVFPPEKLELVKLNFWKDKEDAENLSLVIRPSEAEVGDE